MITCKMNVSKYNGQYVIYGLDFFDSGRMIRRIPNITVSFALIRQLMREINAADLSELHIDDIIEDFLT